MDSDDNEFPKQGGEALNLEEDISDAEYEDEEDEDEQNA